jgi:hypothetical protein
MADLEEQVITMSDIMNEAVSWLWRPYLPLGKITILEGDPGLGKTWLALTLAAIVSTGAPFPSTDGTPGERRPPAHVLYMTAEDGLGDTLKPRLESAGADCSRVHVLTGKKNIETGEVIPITSIGMDYIFIENAIDGYRPELVVIDPLQAYLGAIDMNRANETRPLLTKLATLAEKYCCAMLLIRHLGKSQQDRAIYRGLGSIDFAAAARSILLVGSDPDSPKRRVMCHTKASVIEEGPSINFEIRDGKFYWAGLSECSAADVLRPERADSGESKLDQAGQFLIEQLAGGPKPAQELLNAAKVAGIADASLRRAKSKLSIGSEKSPDGQWCWQLPGVLH